ncbi:MAG: hypothetical protein COB53_12625, partial [Elusimicrobia bacterium]
NAGCAVEGFVDERRLESWRKLQKEVSVQSKKKDTAAQRAEAMKFRKEIDDATEVRRRREGP